MTRILSEPVEEGPTKADIKADDTSVKEFISKKARFVTEQHQHQMATTVTLLVTVMIIIN